ncbi:MAG: response regulator [Flavobacteriales bacterium]|nr:response regulator [Flavobacteriales bacterium]
MKLPLPPNEGERLNKLHYYNILDTSPEAAFDDITRMASQILDVPIVLVSLVDKDRQWFKSKVGLDAEETHRDISFCQYAIMEDELFEVTNAMEDPRFDQNPLVTEDPSIRFYAGAPLTDEEGYSLGTLCAIDRKPKELSDEEKEILRSLSRTVVRLIQLRREKQEVERLSMVKDEFLSSMSHEIRTPMNAIIGFNDLLKNSELDREQSRHVEIISKASKNLLNILNDILDISKIESNNLDIEYRPVDLQSIVEQTTQLFQVRAKEKGLKLLYSFDADIPELVLSDETRLTQILSNLLANAIKFTSEGRVHVSVVQQSREGDISNIVLEVSDTGIGIESGKLDSIFDRFTQADESTTRKYGGTGLGLSIVSKLTELLGGDITVNSTLGSGSTFVVELPCRIPDAKQLQSTETYNGSKSHGNSLAGVHVLIAEDNEHNQLLCGNYLRKNGATFVIANNGREAVEQVEKQSFDLIIMDLQMPELNGVQATEFILKELDMDIPIIACSAHSLNVERDRCIEAGMVDYIVKPYNEQTLIETILSHLPDQEGQAAAKGTNESFQTESSKDSFEECISILHENEGPEFVEQMLEISKRRLPEDMAILNTAIKNAHLETLADRGHLVISSMSSLGLSTGIELAKQVEQNAKADQRNEAIHTAKQLVDYLKSFQTYIHQTSDHDQENIRPTH